MGRGSYTSADWSKLRKSSKITEDSTASQIFAARQMEERFNPLYINMRESRDSDEHPNSTPVIIGLDTTGSMGYLSEEIAKNGLHETMMKIYATNPIEDPQMMFAAVGDVVDQAPLQVTQFESDIRIAEQLLALWLEGGGGDSPEDFELLWYFAAKHTITDAFKKRNKKGYLFTIGDADCHMKLSGENIEKIFGDKTGELTSAELAKMAGEKYELFHIHIYSRQEGIPRGFSQLLPGHVLTIPRGYVKHIPEVIITTMEMMKGKDVEEIIAQWPEFTQPIVRNSVKNLVVKKGKKGFFF